MDDLLDYIWRLPRIARWFYWKIWYRLVRAWVLPIPFVIRFWWINRFGENAITTLSGPVISLTTYGSRVNTVYLTIESIANGHVLPSRIILWLDDRKLFENPPSSISRLIRRGLEVRLTENYGPHTKYYPYVASEKNFRSALVIADDDQLYPRYWLSDLVSAFCLYPHLVNCHWAVVVGLDGNKITSYKNWSRCASMKESFRSLALGTSGVIYPPRLLEIVKKSGIGFLSCCPKGDDLWLHVQAIRNGYRIRQIQKKELYSLQIPGSQRKALEKQNRAGGNDRQIEVTYTATDIQILQSESL